MQKLIEDDAPIEIPPLDSGQYLLNYLHEVGPAMQGDMGAVPLTHGELRCWQENIGLQLQPWEARALIRLSQEYCAQAQKSTKPECPPPYGPIAHRAAVAMKIDEVFG